MLMNLKWLAIAVAALVSIFLGFIWYTPILFGNLWMKLVNLKQQDIDPKGAMIGHLISLAGSFLGCVALAVVIRLSGGGFSSGLLCGAGLSFAFIVTTFFSNDRYEKRPYALSLINSGYRLVFFTMAGVIIGIWL